VAERGHRAGCCPAAAGERYSPDLQLDLLALQLNGFDLEVYP